MNISARSYLTSDIAGIGGKIKTRPEDFEVDEVPAYLPGGEGHHAFLRVRKRDVSAGRLLAELSRHFGVRKSDIGTAGNKDRAAVTSQWVSVPWQDLGVATIEELVGKISDDIEVLQASRHDNKLRTGHLRGNRFRVVIRDVGCPRDEAMTRAQAVIDQLASRGLPNYYGLQRFGRGGETLDLGLGLLRGDAGAKHATRRNRFLRRMAVSALQSEVFNRVLARRMDDGVWDTILPGDVVRKTDTGGTFVAGPDELDDVRERFERREVVPTGPMPGPKMIAPTHAAAQLEDEVLAAMEIEAGEFARFGKLANGTRRPLMVMVDEFDVAWVDGTDGLAPGLEVRFGLPSGSYATVVLRELMKAPQADESGE